MGLSGRAAYRPTDAVPAGGVAEADLRHGVEGPAAADRALSTSGGARESQAHSGDGHRARVNGIHLGDGAGGAGTARVSTTTIRSVRPAASWARWRTLGNVMDISTTDTSVPRARQLRDEPQSGRYPTRGYQQRQPSLTHGAADQTDLTNEEPGKSGHRKRTHDAETGLICLLDRRQPYQRLRLTGGRSPFLARGRPVQPRVRGTHREERRPSRGLRAYLGRRATE